MLEAEPKLVKEPLQKIQVVVELEGQRIQLVLQEKALIQVHIHSVLLQPLSGVQVIWPAISALIQLLLTTPIQINAKNVHQILLGQPTLANVKSNKSNVLLVNPTTKQPKNVRQVSVAELIKSITQPLVNVKPTVPLVKSVCVLHNLLSGMQKPSTVKNAIKLLPFTTALSRNAKNVRITQLGTKSNKHASQP